MSRAILIPILFFVIAAPAFALGMDYPAGQPVKLHQAPAAVNDLINNANRIHGFFVNTEDFFFYAGDTAALESFLNRYAALEGILGHRLIVHPGKGVARSPWDGGEGMPCDWRLDVSRPTKWLLIVHVWTEGNVEMNRLTVPEGIRREQASDADSGIIRPSNRPNAVQRRMIARKYGMFIHFGLNTFHDLEWTDGTLPPSSYAPSAIDTDQWARTAREAGMKYVILTAKHHDGFCLWDSRYTDYDVGSSSNKTDVIAALSRSCQKYGIEMGLYYSLWDRHEPSYLEDETYVRYMIDQLTELLTHYGPVCELWLDGGWEKKREQWNIPAVYESVKRLQPGTAVGVNWTIGLPGNPDAREVSPEMQKEGYPIRYFPSDFRLGDPKLPGSPDPKLFRHGQDLYYLPFESTVCLNRGWFYNTSDTELKSLDELAALYERATAQDNILILNSPPNREGVMTEANVHRLTALADRLDLRPASVSPDEAKVSEGE